MSYSILAIAGGLVVLGLMPQPNDKRVAMATQGGGAVLFGFGVIGLIYALMPGIA